MTKKETDNKIPKSEIIKLIRKYGKRRYREWIYCTCCRGEMKRLDARLHEPDCLIRRLLEL